ncbi:MAG TPA: hypothetical protein VGG03_27135 [Thermoanaerobaculia bacterium]|jgi:hypothetical protein
MSLINAQGDIFKEWEGLLNASQAHAGMLPNADPLRNSLQEILNQARQVKAVQEEHEGRRQRATQQLAELIKQGREVVRRLRSFAKSQLGTNNELLVQFGTAPIRRRTRSAQKPAQKPPAPGAGTPSDTGTPTPETEPMAKPSSS